MSDQLNEQKSAFKEALSYIVETANLKGGVLTDQEIHDTFDEIIEDDSMYSYIYEYLKGMNIQIGEAVLPDTPSVRNGTPEKKIPVADTREQSIIDMYLDEINHAPVLSEFEEYELLQKILGDPGDQASVNLLAEANLKLVIPLADEFAGKEVLYSDLLQEGNLGLLEGIMTYNGNPNLEDFHAHLTDAIRFAMRDAVTEQSASLRIGSHAADRANELDRASVRLSKELDRTPTLEELAAYLSLPVEEVEQVMKMSLNALTIHEDVSE